ncbi:MAG: hypothetical protein C0606_16480 [Hyphomicrobiales bacterium]|nr:MAG: hypothetical protein C0606_16480 [Hyphomicrobiales bacterium]
MSRPLVFVSLLCLAFVAGPADTVSAATAVRTERITITPNEDYKAPETAPSDTAVPSPAEPDENADINDAPADAAEPPVDAATPPADLGPLPEVHYGEEGLPERVKKMRQEILEAARSGDPENLRAVLESNEVMPTLSFGETGDPIEFLKKSSGDDAGQELLAILTEVLEAGWVHIDAGKPQEKYVWPYFAEYPLDALTPPQMVELYRIVTAADVQEMRTYGAYIFYRIGIGPDGTWHYFVAGD